MAGHSRSQNGVASLAYSRSQNGVASLAYVPAISLMEALCLPKRDHRDKPGDDVGEVAPHLMRAGSA
jgi:hypothetical protein